jgi:hypothetical protein
MIKTKIRYVSIDDIDVPAEENGVVYMVCDAEHYLYVGSTINRVSCRLNGHRSGTNSHLGKALKDEYPASKDWDVYILTIEDCRLLTLAVNEPDLWGAERAVIRLYTPALNGYAPIKDKDGNKYYPYARNEQSLRRSPGESCRDHRLHLLEHNPNLLYLIFGCTVCGNGANGQALRDATELIDETLKEMGLATA